MTTEFCQHCKYYRCRKEKDNLGSISVYESCLLNDKIAYPIKYISECKSYETT